MREQRHAPPIRYYPCECDGDVYTFDTAILTRTIHHAITFSIIERILNKCTEQQQRHTETNSYNIKKSPPFWTFAAINIPAVTIAKKRNTKKNYVDSPLIPSHNIARCRCVCVCVVYVRTHTSSLSLLLRVCCRHSRTATPHTYTHHSSVCAIFALFYYLPLSLHLFLYYY